MAEEIDIYTYRLLPWVSKSTISGYSFCQHLFKLRYIDKVAIEPRVAAQTGTNIHMVYAKFFDILDYAKLKKIPLDYVTPIDQTRVFYEIYNTVMSMIPPDSRDYEPYQIMVRNFALIEADHWIDLSRKYGEVYSKILKYFIPKSLEKYLECPALQIYGTLDRKDINEDNEDYEIVYDYKTGNVPIAIREQREYDPSDPWSWKLPSERNRELHFYIVLDMINKGYRVDQDIVDFCTKREYFNDDAELPDMRTFFFDKKGNETDFRDLYRIGIIYTGDENRPYVAKKKGNLGSMRAVFRWINKIRTVLANNGPYIKKPSYFKCRHCNREIQEVCLSEHEKETLFFNYKKDEE